MIRRAALLIVVLLSPGILFAQAAAERVDTAAIAKIRDEGLNRSQVRETLFWLTDRYGPRLDGSPEFEEAADWAIERLRSWGVVNLRKERFASGRGWSLRNFHATMLEPRVMPMIGVPLAWSPGTSGTVRAQVVRPVIATEADAAKYRGTLRGKIVLLQPARAVRMFEYGDGTVLRYDDQDGRWRDEAMRPPEAGRGRGAGAGPRGIPPSGARGPQPLTAGEQAGPGYESLPSSQLNLLDFYKREGVVALFERGSDSDLAGGGSNLSWVQQRPDGGTVFMEDALSPYADPAAGLPQVRLAVEHYNRMVRLLAYDVPVTVELNLSVRFTESTRPNSLNVIGEIPGTDKADEVVLLGAHFDSWHGATGATDNAAGSAAMMEVMRILHATGLKPRRTIRLALWGGEEHGLRGSAFHAQEHFGTRDATKPAHGKLAAYFNLDNGTGPIRGLWMQANDGVAPIFAAWAEPLRDLGVEILSPRRVPSTDHVPFDSLGLPAFQFVQERYEYNSRTHHSTMDFFDRLQIADVRQAATVAAIFAWHAATRDEMLPRRVPGAGGSR